MTGQQGATASEYVLLVLGVALAGIGGIWATGQAFETVTEGQAATLESPYIAPDPSPGPVHTDTGQPCGPWEWNSACLPAPAPRCWSPEAAGLGYAYGFSVCSPTAAPTDLNYWTARALPLCDSGASSLCRTGPR